MPILDIGGQRVQVGDEFLSLSDADKQKQVEEIAAGLPAKPTTVSDVVRSTASGVPILGALANKANAATNAALAPLIEPFLDKGADTLDQPTFRERYRKSLDIQNARDRQFAAAHPVVDTAAKIAGGVGSLTGAALRIPGAAKALGMEGTLPAQISRGAASGAAIAGADEALRGGDVGHGIGWGAAFGAGGPLVGRAVGKVVDKFRPVPPAVPQSTVKVGGVEVPVRPDQATGDVAAAGEAEAILRGARGEPAQEVAQGFEEAQGAAVRRASEEIGAGLDPTGAVARTSPQEAGERVIDDLVANEARRLATEQAGVQRAGIEAQTLRGGPEGTVTPYTAAEMVGEGVQTARDAAVQRTRARYGAVRDEPGTFDPEMVEGLAGDIRRRLGTGDSPEFINAQSAPRSQQALDLMGQMDGLGLFAGRQPSNIGPVAGAVARAGTPEAAEEAVQQLVAQGVNPERARAAVAKMAAEEGGRAPRSALDPHEVSTASGMNVRVVPRVVEASELRTSADPGFPAGLQPRDRTRAASEMQVNDIARNLNPNRLGLSAEADRGAPIIGPDAIVESGNGRVMAIRQVYAEGGASADRYRAWLQSQGVDVSKYREPVLVRERETPLTPADRQRFTIGANQAATMSMSAPERALADARALNADTLGLIRNPGEIGAAENREFVRAFMQTVPATERAALMTSSGELSQEGLTRVRNAVLGRAYGDTPVLGRIAESTSDDVRSISRGLMEAAPEWAALRAKIEAGQVPGSMDITADLVDAVNRTARLRAKGQSLESGRAQADAFTQQSPGSEALQRIFYDADGRKAASSQQIGSALRDYAQQAGKVDAAPGLDLGLAPVTPADILSGVSKKVGAPAALADDVRAAAAAAEQAKPDATGPRISDVGLKEMDAARKRLVKLYGDARKDFQAPNDARVLGRILNEFDNAIIDAFEGGRFSGDSARAAELLREARASHAAYRQAFTSRGGADPIGRDVEKILGRYTDTRATPDEIATLSYGSLSDPGGGKAARIGQRLRAILGDSSPEWAAYKQGLVSHLIDDVPGQAPRTMVQRAERIERFLDGSKGRVLADTVLTEGERDALRSHAASLRAAQPADVSKLSPVERTIARISGRDGGMPATPNDVVNILFSKSGIANKADQVRVAQVLKRDLTPEGWTAVRQGMWEKLTSAGEGKIEFGAQALSQRIHEFLNESGRDIARVMFSEAERKLMADFAALNKQLVPPKGTTNPSGTAWALTRIASKANSHITAVLGGVSGGLPGAVAGYAGTRAVGKVVDARHAREATRRFYGEQPRRPVGSSRVPIVLSQGIAPQVAAGN